MPPVAFVHLTIQRAADVRALPGPASASFRQCGSGALVCSGVQVRNQYCVPLLNAETVRSPAARNQPAAFVAEPRFGWVLRTKAPRRNECCLLAADPAQPGSATRWF